MKKFTRKLKQDPNLEYVDLENNITKVIIKNKKNNGEFLISTEDKEKIINYYWYIKPNKNGLPYIEGRDPLTKDFHVKLHRFLLNMPYKDRSKIVDHINRDTFDNRRENLRIVSYSENNLNATFSKNNKSGRTGVYYHNRKNRSDCYVAKAMINGKEYTKMFSIDKYGKDEAFKKACEYRESIEKQFNILTEKVRND